MNALQLFGPDDIRVVERERPAPGMGEIVIRVCAASICGTDIRMWKNGAKGVDKDHPLTLGHEFSGVIDAVGEGVPALRAGMRVAVQPNSGCGVCLRCQQGMMHLCDAYQAFGVNYDGAFASYVRVPAAAVAAGNVIPLPEGLSFAEGAIAEPLSCVYNGFEKMQAREGERALVIGAGPIGIGHAMLLSMSGARVAMADFSQDRLSQCQRLLPGIQCCGGDQIEEFTHAFTQGAGLDIAVVACPSPKAQAQSVGLMNIRGRVLFFGGIPARYQPVALDTNLVHYRELTLTGSTRSSKAQFSRVLQLMRQDLLHAKALITHTHPFEEIEAAFEQAARGEGLKHVITF